MFTPIRGCGSTVPVSVDVAARPGPLPCCSCLRRHTMQMGARLLAAARQLNGNAYGVACFTSPAPNPATASAGWLPAASQAGSISNATATQCTVPQPGNGRSINVIRRLDGTAWYATHTDLQIGGPAPMAPDAVHDTIAATDADDQAAMDADRRASHAQASSQASASPARRCASRSSANDANSGMDKYAITAAVKACRSWQELAAVVQEHAPQFNVIHTSAAITHLAQLLASKGAASNGAVPAPLQPPADAARAPQPPAQLSALARTLCGLCFAAQPSFRARQATNTFWALAKMRRWLPNDVPPPAALLACYRPHLQRLTGEFREQDVANVLYSLGELRLTPDPNWLAALLQHSRCASLHWRCSRGYCCLPCCVVQASCGNRSACCDCRACLLSATCQRYATPTTQ